MYLLCIFPIVMYNLTYYNTLSQLMELTFGVGCVDGLVSLNEDVSRLKGHQDNFFQQSVGELSLKVHILLSIGILTESRWRDLKPVCRERQILHQKQVCTYDVCFWIFAWLLPWFVQWPGKNLHFWGSRVWIPAVSFWMDGSLLWFGHWCLLLCSLDTLQRCFLLFQPSAG